MAQVRIAVRTKHFRALHEVTEVVFDPGRLSFRGLLEVFLQVHRPDLDAAPSVRDSDSACAASGS